MFGRFEGLGELDRGGAGFVFACGEGGAIGDVVDSAVPFFGSLFFACSAFVGVSSVCGWVR